MTNVEMKLRVVLQENLWAVFRTIYSHRRYLTLDDVNRLHCTTKQMGLVHKLCSHLVRNIERERERERERKREENSSKQY